MPTLSDVAGSSGLVALLREHVVEPLKKDGAAASKRILIYGPPGTGKTFIAKAIAGELGIGFKRLDPHELAVDLANSAKFASKQALVFFDELEWVNYRPLYLEALKNMPRDVIVIGATNYPWRLQGLLAEGFDNVVFMPEPDEEARKGILRHHLGAKAAHLDIDKLAGLTKGYTASDIYHLFEWVTVAGPANQERFESAIGKYRAVQIDEWIAEAKANAPGLDKAAFAPLIRWLADR
jgi:SpoVK/Ycf46/Vps4 family AAA+-type ATPase